MHGGGWKIAAVGSGLNGRLGVLGGMRKKSFVYPPFDCIAKKKGPNRISNSGEEKIQNVNAIGKVFGDAPQELGEKRGG